MEEKITLVHNYFYKHESKLFYVFCVVNLLPLLCFQYFPTVDGVAHLYNSKIIYDLLAQSDSLYNQYFHLFLEPNPNWIGHAYLTVLLLVFPPWLAEKVLLISYLLLLPISFRLLLNVLKFHSKVLSFFIFPFSYSFLLYYGFFNFCFGVAFLVLNLYFWKKYSTEKRDVKKWCILLVLSMALYFSHLFTFLAFIVTALFWELYTLFVEGKKTREYVKVFVFKLSTLIIPIILSIWYLCSHNVSNGDSVHLPFVDIVTMFIKIQPAKGVEYGHENVFTQWIFYSILLICINGIYNLIKVKSMQLNSNKIVLGITLIGCCISIFVVPNKMGVAVGLVTYRLMMLFFIFLILILASVRMKRWLEVSILVIISYVNISLMIVYYKSTYKMNILVEEIVRISHKIEKNSVVLPINETGYWLNASISNYLGVSKTMVVLENYEASLAHFPIRWNRVDMPYLHIGDVNYHLTMSPQRNTEKNKKKIDYIVVIKGNNKSDSMLGSNQIIQSNYNVSYESDLIKLLKAKL